MALDAQQAAMSCVYVQVRATAISHLQLRPTSHVARLRGHELGLHLAMRRCAIEAAALRRRHASRRARMVSSSSIRQILHAQ